MLIAFVLAYMLLTLLVGVWAGRRVKNSGDFIRAGRNLPPFVNAAALFALWFGSETLFGASSEFLTHGLRGVIEDPFGGGLCFVLVGLFFARRLYRLNLLTINDLFRSTYGPRTELVSSLAMVASFFGYTAAQMVALGLIFQSLVGISFFWSLFTGALVVTCYTFYGGMWAVSITDFLQSVVIVFGLCYRTLLHGVGKNKHNRQY